MKKIINLQAYRTKILVQKGFSPWYKRFGEQYCEQTTIVDISNKTLFSLASPGDESTTAFYDMIMGILDLGRAAKFYYMKSSDQLKIIDIHLFLADNIRFELMHRLKWVDNFSCENFSLVEMVQSCDKIKKQSKGKAPILSKSHHDYALYSALVGGDKEAFIRLMLPDAISTFKKRFKKG
ncbi:MAG: hypothetical protein JJW03_02795 [Desulfosarcina sp.]|nr:hypothetical protein [Desulfobacterales bacterium]